MKSDVKTSLSCANDLREKMEMLLTNRLIGINQGSPKRQKLNMELLKRDLMKFLSKTWLLLLVVELERISLKHWKTSKLLLKEVEAKLLETKLTYWSW